MPSSALGLPPVVGPCGQALLIAQLCVIELAISLAPSGAAEWIRTARNEQSSHPRPRCWHPRLGLSFRETSSFGQIAHIISTETAPVVPTPRMVLEFLT